MPGPILVLPSRSAIDKSGKRLSAYIFDGERTMSYDDVDQAIQVVTDFRSAHQYPMQKIRYGLRSMVITEGVEPLITQRLKRVPRIIRKMHRMGNSRLSSLEDIGGCRAVFANPRHFEAVKKRMLRNWTPTRERDYLATPKAMGYRAYHATIERDGRAIEVQLRTAGQQQWADAVEAADARHRLNLKDEDGPDSMVTYFRLAADVIHATEFGIPLNSALNDEFNAARRRVIDEGYYRG